MSCAWLVFFKIDLTLAKFEVHLRMLSGGRKNTQDIKKHMRQVRKVFSECDISDVFSFGDVETLAVIEEKFITKHLEKKDICASTVRNHITSLLHLGTFLFMKSINKDRFYTTEFERFKAYRELWHKTLRLDIAQANVDRFVKDQEEMTTALDFQTYMKSSIATWAEDVLDNVTPINPARASVKVMVHLRNHLATCIAFGNAPRASGISGLTVANFYKAKYWESSNNYTCCVPRHKTSKQKHAAYLGLSPEIYRKMKKFYKMWKAHLKSRGKRISTDQFFQTMNGTAMRANQVSSGIKDMMYLSGFNGKISCTTIRKMTSTMVKLSLVLNSYL